MRSFRIPVIMVIVLFAMIPTLVAGQNITSSNGTSNESIIQITSTPSHAQVLLNNTFQGYTPLEIRNVTPGTYMVTLKLQGYPDRFGEIEAKPNAVTIVAVNMTKGLEPTTGTTPAPTKAGMFIPSVVLTLGIFGYFVLRRK